MLDLNRVFKNDRLMRSLTGMNLAAFDQLLESFSEAYQAAEPPSFDRQRAPGGGRKANLQALEDKLFGREPKKCGIRHLGYRIRQ